MTVISVPSFQPGRFRKLAFPLPADTFFSVLQIQEVFLPDVSILWNKYG